MHEIEIPLYFMNNRNDWKLIFNNIRVLSINKFMQDWICKANSFLTDRIYWAIKI